MTVLSLEAKVGLMATIGLILLATVVFMIGNFNLVNKGYTIDVIFDNVGGLLEGAPVKVSGVQAGKVAKIIFTNKDIIVRLAFESKDTEVYRDDKFLVSTEGLMGQKYIEVIPMQRKGGKLKNGDVTEGENPLRVDQMVDEAKKMFGDARDTLNEIHKLVISLNNVFSNKENQEAMQRTLRKLDETMANISDITGEIKKSVGGITEQVYGVTSTTNRMVRNNEDNINAMVSNFQVMSQSLRVAAANLEQLSKDISADGKNAENVKATIESLRRTSDKVEKMAGNVETLAGDEKFMGDVKQTVKDVQEVAVKANKLFENMNSIKPTQTVTEYTMLYDKGNKKFTSNLNLKMDGQNDQFYVAGVSDLGEQNQINLTLGKKLDNKMTQQFGLIRSKLGIRFEKDFSDKFSAGLEVISSDKLDLTLGGDFRLPEDFSLTFRSRDVLQTGFDQLDFGFKKSF